MGFFDNDDFFGGGIEELFNRLSRDGIVEYNSVGPDGKRKTIKRGKRNIYGKIFLNKVQSEGKTYLIFDLSDKKNISSTIENEIKEERRTGNKVISVKEDDETLFEFPIEEKNIKNFESKFKNGILEVSFEKWK